MNERTVISTRIDAPDLALGDYFRVTSLRYENGGWSITLTRVLTVPAPDELRAVGDPKLGVTPRTDALGVSRLRSRKP
jgi:hypothetical protein